MKDGGSAIMGTGVGRGENRAVDAARMAIDSPLLDNVSIAGARGVLINITGGVELTLGEVTTISDIVKEAVGEETEIIFGAVHEPAMQGEVRVTVIATGFDRKVTGAALIGRAASTPVIPIDPAIRAARQTPTPTPAPFVTGNAMPAARPRPAALPLEDLGDMEIPTFIRRQMD
jgi:cell division protein FtsZ